MSKFLKEFDSSKEEHVRWLKKMTQSKAVNYVRVLEDNPMGLSIEPNDALDWAQVVLVLSTKYTKDIFSGSAFILTGDPTSN
jgi:hypothetical protein